MAGPLWKTHSFPKNFCGLLWDIFCLVKLPLRKKSLKKGSQKNFLKEEAPIDF